MARYLSFILLFTISLFSVGQWNYHVTSCKGINTPESEYASDFYKDGLIALSNSKNSNLNLRTWNTEVLAQLQVFPKQNSFENFEDGYQLFTHKGKQGDGIISFDKVDSIFYFSSSNNFSQEKWNGKQKLYKVSAKKNVPFKPELLPFCKDEYEYSCPYFDHSLRALVFSSNRAGGHGDWDIWYCYHNNGEWTLPANCGGQVNTSSAELFPTIFNGDIYFSSNGWLPEKGFELFKSEGKEQWMNAIQLEYPLNSEGNDYRILFLAEDRGLISSERKQGLGGSDIYLFERSVQRFDAVSYMAKLTCNSIDLAGVEVSVFNSSEELISTKKSNSSGEFKLSDLQFDKKYKFKLENVLPDLMSKVELLILDEGGNVVRKYKFNSKGEVVLELLKFIYSDISLLKNEDRSILGISFEGRVIGKNASVNLNKIPIAILDSQGEIIAIAMTSESGKFQFSDLKPQRQYTFKLSEKTSMDQIVLFDNGKSIVLPILKGESYYRRIAEKEGIELVDERGELLVFSEDDIFIINRIYFDLNSVTIQPQARKQLDELCSLLTINEELQIIINGYTDSRGSVEYNRQLSAQRSKAIASYLMKKGISKQRISTHAFGESELLNQCSNDSVCEEGEHAVNRRTEIKFTSAQKN